MRFEIHDKPEGPVLVCIPGLLGGPEDFQSLLPEWLPHMALLIPDPNGERREEGLAGLSDEKMREISFESSAPEIKAVLDEKFPGRDYFFVGVSLGGKIVYDFAIRYPEIFSGGVITDVGPGPFENSDLFSFVENLVTGIDLTLPWPEMRAYLRNTIPDKNLRILIQTQLSYPAGGPEAIWKAGMKNFKSMLQSQSIDNQLAGMKQVCEQLAAENRKIHILHADHISGIARDVFVEMQSMPCFEIETLSAASHFIHVSNKDKILQKVQAMLKEFYPSGF